MTAKTIAIIAAVAILIVGACILKAVAPAAQSISTVSSVSEISVQGLSGNSTSH